MSMINGTSKPLPTPQIKGIQTIVPSKVTHPRSSRCISLAGPTDTDSYTDSYTDLYRNRCHVILYYRSAHSGDSGWVFAGGSKDSFGRAMEEQPIIGGRAIRGEKRIEIVSNDCGVRLVEARIHVALSEFLDAEEREEREGELVFWKDLDEENPQYCPLLYVQVTNFQCGGYSIGISCSLLLADPSTLISFLLNWAKIHSNMVSGKDLNKLPLHYLPILKSANTDNQIISDPIKKRNKTVIFTAHEKNQNHNSDEELVSFCIEEAESELGVKIPTKTCLFSVTSFEEIAVKKYFRESVANKFQNKLVSVGLDHLGANEISVYQGNKPLSVSSWVYTNPGEVIAILIPSSSESDSATHIIVSIPN